MRSAHNVLSSWLMCRLMKISWMFKHATPGITEAIILEADFTTNLKIIKTNNLSNEGVMWLKINGIMWKLHRIS